MNGHSLPLTLTMDEKNPASTGDRYICAAAEVHSGKTIYSPETGRGAEDADIIGAGPLEVGRDRPVTLGSEI